MTINDLSQPLARVDKFNESTFDSMMNESSTAGPKTMPIAIVGMSCRFPGDATDPNKLWDLCESGRDAWSEIPTSRFDGDAWYHPDKDHIGTVRILDPQVPSWKYTVSLADQGHPAAMDSPL